MKQAALILFSLASLTASAQTLQQLDAERVLLPNGWSLTPAGRSIPLGDLPLNIVVSSAGKYLAVTNNGQSTQSIQLFDPKKGVELDSIVIAKAWFGLKFSADEKNLYVSGGNDNRIWQYSIINNKLVLSDSIILGKRMKEDISPAGIEVDDIHRLMYVVTKENNTLYVINLETKTILQQVKLPAEGYTCVLSPDKATLYISCWGCDKIICFDTRNRSIKNTIAVGDNPNEIILTKNGSRLFVANANDNSVSVMDTRSQKITETLNTALYPNAPSGSTANSLALSGDEKTLYIANADNNCLAVFDISTPGQSRSKGFIPVGWYPTGVKIVDKNLFVINGKGLSSMANPFGPNPYRKKESVVYRQGDSSVKIGVQYIAGLFKGAMSVIPVPDEKQLAAYSVAVYKNTPYTKAGELSAAGEAGNPIPMKVGEPSPIKHVFYVIKENRTYDQVLGDITKGNGDNNLVLFGKNVTPNQHRLAEQFVLMDNFYVDAEVSADGHNWSMGAYATDYLEKTWPTSYGNRGGGYDGEGTRAIANNRDGFIWDDCKRNGISYRSYGEFTDDGIPNIPSLKDHVCKYFTGFDLSVNDTTRFSQWKKDFDSLLAIGKVPAFNTVRFGNDHTEGLKKGKPSPNAFVADNDLAVGLFIEYLSKSPIWKETAVFILEDDAQNGSDHVDAHRSPVYLAGGFVKRNYVDHTMYSTSSVLRTIELILGIPPMTQYDAAAKPMWRSFQNTVDESGFASVIPPVNLAEKNTVLNEWQRRSEHLNFAKEDEAPDDELNDILWVAIKGQSVPNPGPRHAAFVKPAADKEK
jgi:YVTN family beta-propeller protein